jgi:hypothetical protein
MLASKNYWDHYLVRASYKENDSYYLGQPFAVKVLENDHKTIARSFVNSTLVLENIFTTISNGADSKLVCWSITT